MNLVYFTIGGDPKYSLLLSLAIQSIRKASVLRNTHIMVMCDEKYKHIVENIPGVDDIMLVNDNKDHVQCSMRKVEIFHYPKIANYDKVLYLDCDLVVLDDLEEHVFPLFTDNKWLYVHAETPSYDHHNKQFWGFRNYTQQEIQRFRDHQCHVFNCGHFGFCVTDDMRTHFEEVLLMMKTWTKPFFYEQSFMNWYFNTHLLTKEVLQKYVYIPMYGKKPEYTIIVHFANASVPFAQKLEKMKRMLETHNQT